MKLKIKKMMEADFNPRQKVSQFLAFTFIIVISLSLGWYSIKASEEILASMPDSKMLNIENRLRDRASSESVEIQNTLKENKIGTQNGIQE